MLFSSSVFLFTFLPAVTVLYFLIPGRLWRARNLLLFLCSVGFYWCGEHRFVLIMLASIAANWLLGLWAGHAKKRGGSVKPAVAFCVLVNLTVLFIFKYLSFTTRQLHSLFGGIRVVDIALPIGISFYTFQAMSYVFDVSMGVVEAEKNPLNVGLYIAFFPQLIAGPIIKYSVFAGQIRERRHTWEKFSSGTERFAVGFCKKALIANTLASVADGAFGAAAPGASLALLGILAYALQLYFDFSGYSDMAIGLARVFGFEFPENFRYPYVSTSITEYWTRWHISLSEWFRDYLMNPLSRSRFFRNAGKAMKNRWGRRAQKIPYYGAMFIVWLLIGIWHGANWTFILFALIHYIFQVFEKVINLSRRRGKALHWLYTMAVVLIALVMFRAESVSAGWRYYLSMLGAHGFSDASTLFYLRENWLFFLCGILFSAPVGQWLSARIRSGALRQGAEAVCSAALFALFVVAITYVIKGTYNPFIYFNF